MSDADESDVRETTSAGGTISGDEAARAETDAGEAPLPSRRRPPGGQDKKPRAPWDAPKWAFGVLAVVLLALAIALGRVHKESPELPVDPSGRSEEPVSGYEAVGSLDILPEDAVVSLDMPSVPDETPDASGDLSDVTDADSLLDAGRALMKSGRYREALDIFERAASFIAPGDMRAYHAVNAAKNMLGWPTDASLVITPGVSIGSMRLGMSRAEALAAWGDTPYKVNEDGYSVWNYTGASRKLEGTVFFDAEGVIEIVVIATKHSTADGLGLLNFREPKYLDRFVRVRDEDSNPYIYRYTLNDGGLAFYTGVPTAPNRPRAVVYSGRRPLSEYLGARWMRY